MSAVYGEAVTVPLKTLVQNLCTKVPDRAEYRNKMAAVSMNITYLNQQSVQVLAYPCTVKRSLM